MSIYRRVTSGPAHPRSRGENHTRSNCALWATGSSPLTRGKRAARSGRPGRCGLIPAHAGKTQRDMAVRRCRRAHPRSRGENRITITQHRFSAGSSPLTRGKHDVTAPVSCGSRLIPAHAGKTASGAATRRRGWAHPRSRGENAAFRRWVTTEVGSSPLTRGKLQVPPERPQRARLIPAHAGKTSSGIIVCHGFPAHPRSRGENAC